MRPFLNLGGPGITGHAKGCHNQYTVGLKAVKQQIGDDSQGNHRFAKTHIEENGGHRVGLDIIDGISLIIMWLEVH